MLIIQYFSQNTIQTLHSAYHCLIFQLLHHQNRNARDGERKVRRRRRQKRIRKRSSLTAALAVIRDIVRARSDFENGAVDRALVVEIDEEEVRCAAPVSCVVSVFSSFPRDQDL